MAHAVVTRPLSGYLMAPFGWATKPVLALLEADPSLYRALFTLNRQRMHLIALALAHWPGETDPSWARLLLSGAPAAVLDVILGRRPAGLKRALGRLPVSVLPLESYRHLIELLDDPAVAKLIYHVESLTGDCICLLHDVPAPLRRIVARAIDDSLLNPTGLMDGLRFLASRGAAPSFDALVAELGAFRQPVQMTAHLAKLVRQLPLPEPIPPAVVGDARRLDSGTELRKLAKRWKNCLAGFYLDAVDNGRAAVYFWPHAETPGGLPGRPSWPPRLGARRCEGAGKRRAAACPAGRNSLRFRRGRHSDRIGNRSARKRRPGPRAARASSAAGWPAAPRGGG